MVTDHVDQQTVRSAIALANRAPSVHNSQPWRWALGPRSVHLYADLRRRLPITDAEGCDLVVSCGAALHHLRVALAACGYATVIHRMPNPEHPDHLAAVELHTRTVADTDLGLASAITRRRTDRRRFSDWELPDGFVQELVARAAAQGALLRPVTDAHARSVLVTMMGEAAAALEGIAAYRTETAMWSGQSTGVDGVPAANLLRDAVATGGGMARRFAVGLIEQPDTGGADGALLLVLATTSDDPLAQLRAGEALSAVLLHATQLGLATCPLSQPLEVAATRRSVRDQVLDGAVCPQLLLRAGWAPAGPVVPETPRRPVEETIERLPR